MCVVRRVEYSAPVRRVFALGIASVLAACAGPADRVAVEDLDGVDLKIVVARSGAQSEARALSKDAPYRFTLEPLGEVFERGDSLRIWVLGYTSAELGAAFPQLAGRGASDIVDSLTPVLSEPGPGRYPAPQPSKVLVTTVASDGPSEIDYEVGEWSQIESSLQLQFALPGSMACPPLGVVLRAFSRADPGRVCLYTRNEGCEWARPDTTPCPHQSQVFGAAGAIIQQPDGSLRVGETACSPVEAHRSDTQRGESAAFDCAGRVVAVQEQPLDADNKPWIPLKGPRISGIEFTSDSGQWLPVSPGLYYGFEEAGQVELRRVGIQDNEATYAALQHPLLDAPTMAQRTASSMDGLQVTLMGGTFDESVGSAAQQCFRRVTPEGEPLAWSNITGRTSATLTLEDDALGAFSMVTDWQVVGDPGQPGSGAPITSPLRLPASTNGLGRLSARAGRFPTDLVVHGRARTFGIEPVTRFSGPQHLFTCPAEVSQPRSLVGPMIAAPDGYYGLRADGIEVLDADGNQQRVLDNEGETFTRSWTLIRTVNAASQERVVAYQSGTAHVFDPNADTHNVYRLPGRIVAVLPGPDLLYVPSQRPFSIAIGPIVAGRLADSITYAVPAFDEVNPPPLSIQSAAAYASGVRLVGFSSGSNVGVLDLDTGLSTAFPVGIDATIQALFEDDAGTQVWAAVTTSATGLELVRFPKL